MANKPLNIVCPRCGEFIPNNETPGAYPGALSRYTENGIIEVCSQCGQDEAILQMREMAFNRDHMLIVNPVHGERLWVDPSYASDLT